MFTGPGGFIYGWRDLASEVTGKITWMRRTVYRRSKAPYGDIGQTNARDELHYTPLPVSS